MPSAVPRTVPRTVTRTRSRLAAALVAALAVVTSGSWAAPAADAVRRGGPTAPARVEALAAPDCGPVRLKADGTPWECTFADDFSGAELDRSVWVPQQTLTSGLRNGPECYVDRPGTIRVIDGRLRLIARETRSDFFCAAPLGGGFTTRYVAGMVSTWGTFSQTYGRVEFRAKVPAATARGLQSALWLYPQRLLYGRWPLSGEIDVAEVFSQYADRAVPYVHYASMPGDTTVTNTRCYLADPGRFHRYVAVWDETGLRIRYDGRLCLDHRWNPLTLIAPAPFDQPFFVAMTQALGNGTNAFDPATTPLPARTVIDYVRVWR